jgi:lipoprotein-anchoring transpeptidase ErfK/SrfK
MAERDTILSLLEEVISPSGPKENPRWYRLSEGYIHSAYVQRVEKAHQNLPLSQVPERGLIGEVSVPYSQTLYKNRKGEQVKLYRLYFQSLHWITGLIEGPEGKPWYRLTDEWLRVNYYVPATDLRSIPPEELKPISPDVPEEEKLIEVSLEKQMLTAYEGGHPVFQSKVSTGRRFMETPSGEFQVNRKFPSKHMGDGGLTSDLNAYELVGVPWVSFFHNNGVAFHGTFWHDNFGARMSQGCVNMRNEAAKWLFRWCNPTYGPEVEFRSGYKRVGQGTKVIVKE